MEKSILNSAKSNCGRFFEDFAVGMRLKHPTPRTLSDGDSSLYKSLFPDCRCLYSSDEFARNSGLKKSPICDLLVFHIVFGKSVKDISLNAVANLGYASGLFHLPVYAGDTLSAESTVIGLKENSNRKSGIVYVHTRGVNQLGETVLEFTRWVMVSKKDPESNAPKTTIPNLSKSVNANLLPTYPDLDFTNYDFDATGEDYRFGDYSVGEVIEHGSAITIEESEHVLATRLWQNFAKLHFDTSIRDDGRRLLYGGHIISLALALSGDGLANAQTVIALNGGSHLNPCFAGDTVRAKTHVVDVAESRVPKAGALRLRTIAYKSQHILPSPTEKDILLDFDYWVLIPI